MSTFAPHVAASAVTYLDLAEMPPEVLQLLDAAECVYPEFSAGWFANLQRTVFRDAQAGVRYLTAVRAGEPQAILPMRGGCAGYVRRLEALGNYYTSLYSPILGPNAVVEDLATLLRTVRCERRAPDEMRFAPMNPAAPAYALLLAALRQSGWAPFEYGCFSNWYLPVSGTFDDYLKSRTASLRSTIKRMKKKFAANGGTVEIITTEDRVAQGIEDYHRVYSRSWKQPEPYPDFIPGLMRLLAAKGSLRLGIARLAEHPIAAQLWLTSHGKSLIFKVAYDEAYAGYSPGTLLTSHLMEYVIESDQVGEVDFLTGEDAYKKNWMSHQRERKGIVAYHPGTLMGLGLMSKKALGNALRTLRNTLSGQ